MRLEELPEDGTTELNQYVLHLREVALALRLSQNAKADLHSLDVVTIGTHRCHLALFRLVLLQKCANDQD